MPAWVAVALAVLVVTASLAAMWLARTHREGSRGGARRADGETAIGLDEAVPLDTADADLHRWTELAHLCAVLEPGEVRREILGTALALTGADAVLLVLDNEAPASSVSSVGLEPGEETVLLGELPPFPLAGPVAFGPGTGSPPGGQGGCLALPFRTGQREQLGRLVLLWRSEQSRPGPRRVEVLVELAASAADVMVGARQLEAVRQTAIRDHVTGLYSKAFFHAALEQEVAEAQRHGRRLAVAVLDLDDFRAITDAFGSAEASGVLGEVAARLGASTRKSDVTSCLGGDAFGVILPGSGSEHAQTLYERTRTAIAGPTLTGIGVSLSAGIAELDRNEDAASLLAGAGVALRRAKLAGKNRSSVRVRK